MHRHRLAAGERGVDLARLLLRLGEGQGDGAAGGGVQARCIATASGDGGRGGRGIFARIDGRRLRHGRHAGARIAHVLDHHRLQRLHLGGEPLLLGDGDEAPVAQLGAHERVEILGEAADRLRCPLRAGVAHRAEQAAGEEHRLACGGETPSSRAARASSKRSTAEAQARVPTPRFCFSHQGPQPGALLGGRRTRVGDADRGDERCTGPRLVGQGEDEEHLRQDVHGARRRRAGTAARARSQRPDVHQAVRIAPPSAASTSTDGRSGWRRGRRAATARSLPRRRKR